MAQKQPDSSAHAKRRVKNVRHMPDSKIDFSDIPEMSDEELSRGRRVGRPRKDHSKQLEALDAQEDEELGRLAEERARTFQRDQALTHQAAWDG